LKSAQEVKWKVKAAIVGMVMTVEEETRYYEAREKNRDYSMATSISMFPVLTHSLCNVHQKL